MHDYDPAWDYDVVKPEGWKADLLERVVRKVRREVASELGFEGFSVFAVARGSLGGGVAVYVDGTSDHPCIGVDPDSHLAMGDEAENQIAISLAHELAHSYQETLGAAAGMTK